MNEFKAWVDLSESDMRRMLLALTGSMFGDEPEKKIPEIRASRKGVMEWAADLCSVNSNDAVLDLGSGCGFGTYWLAKRAKHVFACDISPGYLSFASRECAQLGNISFHLINSRHLDFLESDSIDVVCSISVFIHLNIYDIFAYFGEFQRILKPGGRVLIDIANADKLDFDNPGRPVALFLEHAESYRKYAAGLAGLMMWNSSTAVEGIAKRFGFKAIHRFVGEDTFLVFEKTPGH